MYAAPLNQVFNEDGLVTLERLPDNSIDMVFGDPAYNVGINYYDIRLTSECLRVLKRDGNLFMLNYPKQNAYLRVKFLDDASFGVCEYVWNDLSRTDFLHSKKSLQ